MKYSKERNISAFQSQFVFAADSFQHQGNDRATHFCFEKNRRQSYQKLLRLRTQVIKIDGFSKTVTIRSDFVWSFSLGLTNP
jgi:hypothetical protein